MFENLTDLFEQAIGYDVRRLVSLLSIHKALNVSRETLPAAAREWRSIMSDVVWETMDDIIEELPYVIRCAERDCFNDDTFRDSEAYRYKARTVDITLDSEAFMETIQVPVYMADEFRTWLNNETQAMAARYATPDAKLRWF